MGHPLSHHFFSASC